MPVGHIKYAKTKNPPSKTHVFCSLERSGFFEYKGALYVKISRTHAHKIRSIEEPVAFEPMTQISGTCVDIHVTDYLT